MAEENNRYREEEKDEELNKVETPEEPPVEKSSGEEKTSNEEKTVEDKKETNKKIKKLKEENEKLNQEIKKLQNDILMVKADEINFKKRIEEEKDRLVSYGNQKLLEKMVGELDLFDKVVNSPVDDPVLKNYLIGFEMINNNFKNILEQEGVKKIVVKVGDEFDPRFHHVLQTGWDENYKENAILAELRGGYMYKDRVLCTTIVKVNKKESE